MPYSELLLLWVSCKRVITVVSKPESNKNVTSTQICQHTLQSAHALLGDFHRY